MKKILLITVLLAAVAGAVFAGVTFWLLREPAAEWTTRSPRALREFTQGLEDQAKIYRMDAVHHFEEALELDPSFVMAKLQLAFLYSSESERRRMLDELREVDPGQLNPRERFLLAYRLARADGRDGDAQASLDAFLEHHPSDPYGIRVQCALDWEAQEWDAAEGCYNRLLELHPTWVEARNHLGYIAMARGRFDEAEERFRTYRYLAPDQANPYHSLSELFTVLGRYEEAEEDLAEVIRIKPDFCPAYTQLAEVGFLSGRLDLAERAISDLESIEACDLMKERGVACSMRAWVLYARGDAEGAWKQLEGGCLERRQGFDLLGHRIAVMTGRSEEATRMEAVLSEYRDEVEAAGRPVHAKFLAALLAHMQGIRALAAGDLHQAVERLNEADAKLGYWGGERASIKLFNRLNLLRALELLGRVPQAEALRRQIDEVNPRLVDAFPLPDVDALRRVGAAGLPPSFPLRDERLQ